MTSMRVVGGFQVAVGTAMLLLWAVLGMFALLTVATIAGIVRLVSTGGVRQSGVMDGPRCRVASMWDSCS